MWPKLFQAIDKIFLKNKNYSTMIKHNIVV